MTDELFHLDMFLEALEITQEELRRWERMGLIRPLGMIDGETPFYTAQNLQDGLQIKKLLSVGYGLGDIQSIVRKVGLPSSQPNGKKKESPQQLITVGELAKQTGLNPRTIKYWEERGIIEPDGRSTGGFRLYARHYIFFCELIRDLQNFGYSLDEIKEIAEMFRDFVAIQRGAIDLYTPEVYAKLSIMQERVTHLDTRMKDLKQGIKRWEDLLRKKRKEIQQLYAKAIPPDHDQVQNGKPKRKKQ